MLVPANRPALFRELRGILQDYAFCSSLNPAPEAREDTCSIWLMDLSDADMLCIWSIQRFESTIFLSSAWRRFAD
jgi:hypothetical protein